MRLRIPSRRAVAFAMGTIAACYFAFWACAPTAVIPPPVPFAEDQWAEFTVEAGLGTNDGAFHWGERWETIEEGGQVYSRYLGRGLQPEGQIAFVGQPVRGLSVGGQAYIAPSYEMDVAVGAGAFARYLFRPSERFAMGVAGQVGWLHAGLGLPVSFRLGERFWLWTQPGAGLDYVGLVTVPLGLSYETPKGGVWSVQAALKALGYDADTHLHLGVSFSPRLRRE
jgi:hypothetical protein